jgi:TQXA domain-containing protein
MNKKKLAKEIVSVAIAVVVFLVTFIAQGYATETNSIQNTNETSQTDDINFSEKILDCKYAVPHTHCASCYDENGDLVCGLADYVLHTHDKYCYKDGVVGGELVCKLLETPGQEHTHDASCYTVADVAVQVDPNDAATATDDTQTQPHQHTADCLKQESKQICGLEEGGHVHTLECYKLICGVTEGHVHDPETCYTLVPDESTKTEKSRELVCPYEENHTHTDACFATETTSSDNTTKEKQLTCTKEEHQHNDSCYTVETGENGEELGSSLTCGKEEHSHGDSCYEEVSVTTTTENTTKTQICDQPENHTHTDDCYEITYEYSANKELTCNETGHEHISSCYSNELICGQEANDTNHVHDTSCFETIEVCTYEESSQNDGVVAQNEVVTQSEEVRICGKLQVERHQHTAACFRDITINDIDQTVVNGLTAKINEALMGFDAPEFYAKLEKAMTDESVLNELAELLEVDPMVLKLYLQGNFSKITKPFETEKNTKFYELNGKMAFSLNMNRNNQSNVTYKALSNVSSEYAYKTVSEKARHYKGWYKDAIEWCASYYDDESMLSEAATLFGDAKAKEGLREAIQLAIWYYTDSYSLDTNTPEGKLANKIQNSAYWDCGRTVKEAKGYTYDWYEPSDSSAPYLLVAASVANDTYDKYIGIDGGAINIKNGTSGSSKKALYIVDETTYMRGDAAKRKAASTVAYCFNLNKSWPYNTMSDVANDNRVRYTKLDKVTGSQFAKYADNETVTGDELREWVISIGLNGYPYDFSGFNRKDDGSPRVSETQFRILTQYAIWYYTDNLKDYNANLFDADENYIYYKLVGTKLDKNITSSAKSNINLYIDSESQTKKGYQNLLTVETTSDKPIPDNGQKPVTLTLTKNVDGIKNADEFKFTITLTDKSGKPITGEQTVTPKGANITSLTFDSKGVAEVILKDGQTITINNLPYGTSYKIVEDKYSDYTTKVTASSGETTVNNSTRTAYKKFMSANEAVTYLNTYEEITIVPPTGVRTDMAPLITMTCITMAGLVLMVIRRITKGRWV